MLKTGRDKVSAELDLRFMHPLGDNLVAEILISQVNHGVFNPRSLFAAAVFAYILLVLELVLEPNIINGNANA